MRFVDISSILCVLWMVGLSIFPILIKISRKFPVLLFDVLKTTSVARARILASYAINITSFEKQKNLENRLFFLITEKLLAVIVFGDLLTFFFYYDDFRLSTQYENCLVLTPVYLYISRFFINIKLDIYFVLGMCSIKRVTLCSIPYQSRKARVVESCEFTTWMWLLMLTFYLLILTMYVRRSFQYHSWRPVNNIQEKAKWRLLFRRLKISATLNMTMKTISNEV